MGAFQRILSILIGGMLVYFGYRLFLSLPGKRGRDGGSGEFALGRASKVKLSKVGPGVFFAIFGAGLIAYSFAKPMKVNIPRATPSIVALNRALASVNASERPELERAVTKAKVSLMETLWAEDWGELKDFRVWLAKGGTAPDKTQSAVDYFQRK